MSPDRSASAAKTTRHEVCVTTHASGAPATTAPRLPANIVTPASVAKRCGGNHTAESFSTEMKATRDADADECPSRRRDLPHRCQCEQQRSGGCNC